MHPPRSRALRTAAAAAVLCRPAAVAGAGKQDFWTRPDAPMSRIYDLFFTDLNSARPCVLLSALDGPTGCGTASDATAGLFLIDSNATARAFAESPPEGEWAVVVDVDETAVLPLLTAAAASRAFAGAVVLQRARGAVRDAALGGAAREAGSGLSGAARWPNGGLDLYKPHGDAADWNPQGTDASFVSYGGSAVVLVSETDFAHARDEAARNRDNGYGSLPRRAAQYYYPMMSLRQNASECLAKNGCMPVGSYSLWGSVKPLATRGAEPEYLLIAVAVTDTNLFHDSQTPGASVVAGPMAAAAAAVEMLADAYALANLTEQTSDLQVIFGFFVGEEYGAMGSRRFVDDVRDFVAGGYCQQRPWTGPPDVGNRKDFYCYNPPYPDGNFTTLELSRVKWIIGLDQVGLREVGTPAPPAGLFVHYDDPGQRGGAGAPTAETERLKAALLGAGAANASAGFAGRLPPGPAQSFVRQLAAAPVGAVVLAGHPGPYTNKFLHSVYDTVNATDDGDPRVDPELVHSAALAVASAAWSVVAPTGTPFQQLRPEEWPRRVAEMVGCLGADTSCDLLVRYWPPGGRAQLRKQCPQPCAPNWYPGVIGPAWDNTLMHVSWLHDYLVEKLDRSDAADAEKCTMDGVAHPGSCGNGTWQYCVSTGEDADADGFDGTCRAASVYFHPTYSVGLTHQTGNYSGVWNISAGTATPVWTESTWGNEWGTRLFTTDSSGHEAVLLVGGVLTAAASFFAAWQFNPRVLPQLKMKRE